MRTPGPNTNITVVFRIYFADSGLGMYFRFPSSPSFCFLRKSRNI